MVSALEQEIRELQALVGSARDPEGRAFVPLADAYRRAGDPDRAEQIVAEGLARHPGVSSGHLVAAWIQRDLGHADAAESAFRRVLDMDGDNAAALVGLGSLLVGRGDPEGRRLIARGRDLDPRFAPEEPPVEETGEVEVVAAVATEPESERGVVDVAELAPDPRPESSHLPVDLHGMGVGSEGDLVIEWDVDSLDDPSAPEAEEPPDDWGETTGPEGPGPEESEEPWPVEAVAPDAPEAAADDVVDPWSEGSEGDDGGMDDGTVAPEEEATPAEVEAEGAEREGPAIGTEWQGAEAEWLVSVAEWVEAEVTVPESRPEAPEAEEADDLLMELAELAPDLEPGGASPVESDVDEPALPTRTLAELYARQGLVSEAVAVMESLVARRPDDADLRARLEELRGDAATPGGGVEAERGIAAAEVAPVEEPEVSGPSVVEFMDRLLGWRSPGPGDA